LNGKFTLLKLPKQSVHSNKTFPAVGKKAQQSQHIVGVGVGEEVSVGVIVFVIVFVGVIVGAKPEVGVIVGVIVGVCVDVIDGVGQSRFGSLYWQSVHPLVRAIK
jgi:hypothetical protein